MEWVVIECLACPVTGTFFSSAITEDNTWLIVWMAEGSLLQSGDVIELADNALTVKNGSEERCVFMICTFKSGLWKLLQKSTFCQGERVRKPQQCSESIRCSFRKCPYGLRKIKQI